VVDEDGCSAGVFGEREFIAALFPGYLGELRSARFVPAVVEEQLETRVGYREEPVSRYMTAEPVAVGPDYSDIELAETFLHHRVSVVPVIGEARVVRGFVTRTDFFRALWERIEELDGPSSER
jgi:CBS domain-containing protein